MCPGAIQTDIWSAIPADQREKRFRKMTERLPVNRISEPDEVVQAYLYLMLGGYTQGQHDRT